MYVVGPGTFLITRNAHNVDVGEFNNLNGKSKINLGVMNGT